MTTYLDIVVLQEPFDLGLDEFNRARVAFNILTNKHASATFLEEIFQILVDASVADRRDIYGSSSVAIPKTGNLFSITETGGTGPVRIHNQAAPAYQRPGAQIIAIAVAYDDARTMARAAYDALAVVRNQTVTPT